MHFWSIAKGEVFCPESKSRSVMTAYKDATTGKGKLEDQLVENAMEITIGKDGKYHGSHTPREGTFCSNHCHVWEQGHQLYTWAGAATTDEDRKAMRVFAQRIGNDFEIKSADVHSSEQGAECEALKSLFPSGLQYYHTGNRVSSIWTSAEYTAGSQVTELSDAEQKVESKVAALMINNNILGQFSYAAAAAAIAENQKRLSTSEPSAGAPLTTFCPRLAPLRLLGVGNPKAATEKVVTVCTSADGLMMAVAMSRKVYVYDVQSGAEITSHPINLDADVMAVAFAPKKKYSTAAGVEIVADKTRRVIAIKLETYEKNLHGLQFFEFETDRLRIQEALQAQNRADKKADGETLIMQELKARKIKTTSRLAALTDLLGWGVVMRRVDDAPGVQLNLDRECEECFGTVGQSRSRAEDQLAFSPDGSALLVNDHLFPAKSRMPTSIITGGGHLVAWSPATRDRLLTASGQIVRIWDTNIKHCLQNSWRQRNFSFVKGGIITALTESSDGNAVAVGFELDKDVDEPEPAEWFPGESFRSVSLL